MSYGMRHNKVTYLRSYNGYRYGRSTDMCTGVLRKTYGQCTG